MLLACLAYYPYTTGVTDYFFSAYPSQFGHTAFFVALDTVGDGMTCQPHWATSSEPASYAWTQNATSGLTGIILAYRNVQSVDGYSNSLSSASAGFTSNDVGKLICLATQSTSLTLGQVCGNISSYISATQVGLNVYAGFGSSTQFSYGTDSYGAFNSAALFLSVGCNLELTTHALIKTQLVWDRAYDRHFRNKVTDSPILFVRVVDSF